MMRLSLVSAALWIAACKTLPPPPPPPPEPEKKPTALYEWNGEGKGISHITINVDHQKAYLFAGKKEVGWTYVATGIPSFPTPTGNFKIQEKVSDKVSNLYGKGYDKNGKLINSDFKVGRDLLPEGGRFDAAKMPYFMRLTGDGVGMHIGPIPRPGRRASHGCIRMPAKIAATIYRNVSIGTPVSIVGSGPDYQTYLSQAAAKSRANAAKLAASKQKAAEEAASKGEAETGEAPAPPEATASQSGGGSTSTPPALVEEVKLAEPVSENPGN